MNAPFVACLAAGAVLLASVPAGATDTEVPADIRAVIEAPRYEGATWGMRAVALDADEPLLATGPDTLFFTGSVRKLFSVGMALNALGADHRFRHAGLSHRRGLTPDGVLNGDLVLVASADLTLGGRNLPDGTLAFTNFDHTESNSLGSSILTAGATDTEVPPDIRAVIEAPRYEGATWGMRAVALDADEPLLATGPDTLFFTGSVRKLFSVGMALNALGADHRFLTPVYRTGDLTPDGVLNGDLVLVAAADLTLGGRNLPDGTLAFTNFDHTESNSLGSSILTDTDPLAGLTELAARGRRLRRQGGQGRRHRRRPAVRAFPGAERQRPDHAGHRQRQPDRRDHPADRAGPAGERRLAAEERRFHRQVRGDHGRGRRACGRDAGDIARRPDARRRHGPDPGRLRAVAPWRADPGPDLRHTRPVGLCAHRLHRGAGRGRA